MHGPSCVLPVSTSLWCYREAGRTGDGTTWCHDGDKTGGRANRYDDLQRSVIHDGDGGSAEAIEFDCGGSGEIRSGYCYHSSRRSIVRCETGNGGRRIEGEVTGAGYRSTSGCYLNVSGFCTANNCGGDLS